MAKSPKKSGNNSKTVSNIPYSKGIPSKIGGKKIKAYGNKKNFTKPPKRRFSIADTSSSSSNYESENEEKYNYYANRSRNSGSDSDSSLTAVTDNDETEASRKGSVFFESADNEELYKPNKKSPKKSKQTNRNKSQSRKSTKTANNTAKKRTPKKTVNWNQWESQVDDSVVSEDSESSSDEDNVGLGALYSMMNNQKHSNTDSDESESESESESDEEEHDYSSSDDSDVDFVKLQAERKAKSMKAAKAMKGISNRQGLQDYEESDLSENSEAIPEKKVFRNRRRSSSISKPKFGRRKSDVALPDINFTFEFDDYGKFDNAIIDEEDEEDEENEPEEKNDAIKEQEEDIGEEISFAAPKKKKGPNSNDDNNDNANHNFEFDFDFNAQLPQVPKINDTELNSDEDYEIDDNELLATLQADNDMDQFSTPGYSNIHTRNNSVGSYGDEEENDPFLKEEEKFLVNEFENNGFDDDESINVGFDYNNQSDRDNLIESFNEMNSNQKEDVIQYASSDDDKSDDEDDEADEDEYDDFIDFDAPLFDKDEEDDYDVYEEFKVDDQDTRKHLQNKKKKSRSKRRHNGSNSDEEDDSYLWNYFFSSDNSSQSSDEEDDYRYDDSEEKAIMEKLLKNIQKENRSKKISRNRNKSVNIEKHHYAPSDNEYDSGESTDIDLSLPQSTDEKSGSKMAKEVLSSKTADYRPPVLGTWVAIDSKPFGIIDGLSTRSLGNTMSGNSNHKQMEPRLVSRKGISSFHPSTTDDLALGLDELLNVSELDDDDENDARIWRDFNSQKKQVPLGAFRNKSILQNQLVHPENVTVPSTSSYNHTSRSNNDFNKRRYSLSSHQTNRKNLIAKPANVKKPSHDRKPSFSHPPTNDLELNNKIIPSKVRRRRASNVEAVSEGFRPTKSGLFSEDALADVEEILGEDADLMGLIKGL